MHKSANIKYVVTTHHYQQLFDNLADASYVFSNKFVANGRYKIQLIKCYVGSHSVVIKEK